MCKSPILERIIVFEEILIMRNTYLFSTKIKYKQQELSLSNLF